MPENRDSLQGPSVASSRLGLNKKIARLFFGLGCGMSLLGALVYGSLAVQLQPGMREMLVIACLVLAVAFALAIPLLSRAPLGTVMMAVGWSGVSIMALTSVGMGEGVHSLSLGFFSIIVCLVTVLTSLRAGIVLALVCAAAVLALNAAESSGWLAGAAAVAQTPNTLNVLIHGMLLATAVVAGTQMSRIMNRAMAEADEREQRFRSLLAIAADWYWELDAELRFSRIDKHLPSGSGDFTSTRVGLRPWEVQDMHIEPAALALHREHLLANRPFSDLPVRYQSPTGLTLHFSVSGRPRFDDKGRFAGYWGVGRDVTAEVLARAAHNASEHRYRELFALSPTPLVLHRGGITMQANEATAQLFAFASAEAM
ncbi:MAG: PAS domain-containing protein, partial [Cytophagales bacterium]|nr:PAS domain-containing protein [Rhizobacter sp.]